MTIRLVKQNCNAWRIAILAALLAPAVAMAGKPAPSFGLSVTRTKLGDSYEQALYGGGAHAMARYGNELVVAYTESDGSNYNVKVRLGRSLDGGLTWLPSIVVTGAQSGMDQNGVQLAVGPDPAGGSRYRIHISYRMNQGVYYTYATALYGGALETWFGTPALVSGTTQVGYSSIATDPLGGVHIAFDGTVDGVSGVRYSRSADCGTTFVETAVLVSQNGQWPVLASDAAGDVYAAFFGNSGTFVSKRAAGTPAFASPVLVTTTWGAELSLASSSDGTYVYLAWVDNPYHVARSTNGGTTWTTFDGPAGSGNFQASVAVSPAGKVGLAFNNYQTAELGYVSSVDHGQSWSAPAIIPDATWGATLLFDAAEKANIAFVNARYGNDFGFAVNFTKEK